MSSVTILEDNKNKEKYLLKLSIKKNTNQKDNLIFQKLVENTNFEVYQIEGKLGSKKNDQIIINSDILISLVDSVTQKLIDDFNEVFQKEQNIKILTVVSEISAKEIIKLYRSGVKGILLKNEPIEKIINSISSLTKGGSPISSSLNIEIAEYFHNKEKAKRKLFNKLGEREIQILKLLLDGLTNRQIGEKIHITTYGVKYHINRLLSELNVANRIMAIKKLFKINYD